MNTTSLPQGSSCTKCLRIFFVFPLLLSFLLIYASVPQSKPEVKDLNILTEGQQKSLLAAIAAANYHVTWQQRDGEWAYRAPNYAQSLDVALTPDGLQTTGYAPDGAAWTFGLVLAAYGDLILPGSVDRTALTADEDVVTYAWNEAVSEWFHNTPAGIEHGLTLYAPPKDKSREHITLTFALQGDLIAHYDAKGESVWFTDANGQTVLNYDQLSVYDADGRDIPASMRVQDDQLLIALTTSDATYPLTVDPLLWSETAKLKASDAQLDDEFGNSVSIDGTTLVVGADKEDGGMGDPLYNSGAAYIFERDYGGPGNWGEVAILRASDAQEADYFGQRVSISGNTVVVGAVWEDGGAGDPITNSGAAYIFERDYGGADNWGEVTILHASNAGPDDEFGGSVSISGDTIVVGTLWEDGDGDPTWLEDSGAAYIFERDHGGTDNWGEAAILRASDASARDHFGDAVSISGNTVVVGAIWEDGVGGGPNQQNGAAYIFERDHGGVGNWGEVAILHASDGQPLDFFGNSVSISGDTVVVGAFGQDDVANSGAAYIYERNWGGTDNWGEVTMLHASDAEPGDQFGRRVSVGGNTIVVGAWEEDGSTGNDSGAAYIYERNWGGTDNWGEDTVLRLFMARPEDRFGNAVGVSGETVVVGAFWEDSINYNTGAVFVYEDTLNDPPVVDAGGPYSGNESAPITLDEATAVDGDGDVLSYAWSVDSALCSFSDASILHPTITCADSGAYAVTLAVSDGEEMVEDSATLTIYNVAPTILNVEVPIDPVDLNQQALYGIDVTFSDPAGNYDEPYTCSFDLDYDGVTFVPDVVVSGVTGTACSTPFNYSEPGAYIVMVQVSDKDGSAGEALSGVYVVVYNPDGGFVTGGGWIWSEPGACLDAAFCDLTASGKGHFALVVKYLQGAGVPTGNTNFKLTAGGMNFKSDSYDWLIVNQNNSNAQYKGSGFVNGATAPTGELFRFMIWAKDLDPNETDTFRIRIWYEDATGNEVDIYDNSVNQPIDHGNIKIHAD